MARIKKQHLLKSKEKGGFGLPFFKAYYWAAHLNIFSWWRVDSTDVTCEQPEWLRIEQALSPNSSLQALCNSPGKISKLIYNRHFVIGQSLKIWKQIRIYIKAHKVYFDSPICKNHSFIPALNDMFFSLWKRKGIGCIGSLYMNEQFLSFKELQSKYELPNSHFFRYLQIRDYVRKYFPDFEQFKKHDKLEEINRFKAGNSKAVSYFYNLLIDLLDSDTTTIRKAWEEDLGYAIDDAKWEECLQNVHDCSINTRHNLIQFKSLHRVFMCKTKLHKIFPA